MRIHPRNRLHRSAVKGALMLTLTLALAPSSGCRKPDESPKAAGLSPSGASPVPAPAPPSQVAAVAPAGGGATLSGRITLASARKADVSPSDVVYLVARRVPDSP